MRNWVLTDVNSNGEQMRNTLKMDRSLGQKSKRYWEWVGFEKPNKSRKENANQKTWISKENSRIHKNQIPKNSTKIVWRKNRELRYENREMANIRKKKKDFLISMQIPEDITSLPIPSKISVGKKKKNSTGRRQNAVNSKNNYKNLIPTKLLVKTNYSPEL